LHFSRFFSFIFRGSQKRRIRADLLRYTLSDSILLYYIWAYTKTPARVTVMISIGAISNIRYGVTVTVIDAKIGRWITLPRVRSCRYGAVRSRPAASHRRAAISQYCSSISIPTACRPSSRAAKSVLPLPANGSSITPPVGVAVRRHR